MRFTAPWGQMLSLLLTPLGMGIILLHHVPNVMASACISAEQKEEIMEGKKALFSFVAATDLLALENPLERSDWEDALFVHWQLKTENITAFEQELGLLSSENNNIKAQIAKVAILNNEEKKPYLSMMVRRVGLVGLPDTVQIDWMIYVTMPEQTEPTLMVIDSLYDFRATTPVGFTRASRRLTYNVESNKVSLAANKEDPDALRVFLDLSKTSEGRFDSSFSRAFDKLYWPSMVYSKLFTNGSLSRAKVKVANKKMMDAEGESASAAAAAYTIAGNLPWSDYTLPNPTHITYVPNTIQMGSEVWVNAKEESRLLLRQRNQIYKERARLELAAVTNGESEPKALFNIADSVPSYFINFKITDPQGLAAAVSLPEGFSLAPIKFREHGQEDYYLTLNVYGIEGLENGIRAEWKVFVKEEGSDFLNVMLIQITSNNMSPIPVGFNMARPFKPAASTFVNHWEEDDDMVVTDIRVTSLREQYSFSTTFPNPGACTLLTEQDDDDNFDVCDRAHLDLITANDRIYYRNGIYDVSLWDASVGAMTFSVVDPSTVAVSDTTKWTEFVDSRPHEVLVYYPVGEFMISPWNNAEEIDTCSFAY